MNHQTLIYDLVACICYYEDNELVVFNFSGLFSRPAEGKEFAGYQGLPP